MAAVVLAKGADLSVVVLKVVDLVRVDKAVVVGKADRVVKVVKAKTAVKAIKFIMGSRLL